MRTQRSIVIGLLAGSLVVVVCRINQRRTSRQAEQPPKVELPTTKQSNFSAQSVPQFVNVLKGEMSIVGPRPERPFFVQKFLEDVAQYNTRHYLKVGITGWAQVNGWRGDTSIPRRVEHDLYYLRHWSLGFDLKIMALTVWRTLIANRNAY